MCTETFVLVFMDGSDRTEEAGFGRFAEVSAAADMPSLATFLGVTTEDLLATTFDGHRVFEARPEADDAPIQADAYLTVVALRTLLRDAGHSVVACLSSEIDDLAVEDPEVVGISTTFGFSTEAVRDLCARVRARFPRARLLLGGAGLTLNPGWFAASGADCAVVGDAENALPALLDGWRRGDEATAIPNLLLRTPDGEVRATPRAQQPIDEIPTPRWDLATGCWPRLVWYESERGCPFRCTFCSYPQQALAWTFKSAERMADEFAYYASRGVERVSCLDSTMVTPPARMAAFCDLLTRRGIEITWGCFAHAANLQSAELCAAMFEAGCRDVSIGLESYDQTILANMKKKVAPHRIDKAIQNCFDAGLFCHTNLIIGFPGETRTTLQNTVDGLSRLSPDSFGTQTFQVRDRSIPILDLPNHNLRVGAGAQPDWRHDTMDRTEARAMNQQMIWELLFRAAHTVAKPVSMLSRVRFRTARSKAMAHFRRNVLAPCLSAYGRYTFLQPEWNDIDQPLMRPSSVPTRSASAAKSERSNALACWHRAVRAEGVDCPGHAG